MQALSEPVMETETPTWLKQMNQTFPTEKST